MDHDFETLEESLRREPRIGEGAARASGQEAPPRFLRVVRSRRRRVYAARAASTLAALAIGSVGLMGIWRSVHPPVVPPVQQVVYTGSPAMRKFRELPPEFTAGPGVVEMSRVLDARNPETVGGLGGM